MKQCYTFIFFLLVFNTYAFSQNTYPFPQTNPVGIGIDPPASGTKLHVYRNVINNFNPVAIFEDGTSAGFTQIALKSAVRQYHIGIGNNTAGLDVANKFFVWDQFAGAMRMVIATNGFTGLGTTAPKTRLDLGELRLGGIVDMPAEGSILEATFGNYILGDVNIAQQLRMGVSNDLYTRAEIFLDNSNRQDGTIAFKTANVSGGATTRMFINGQGNVSIGTTDAKGYKFAVNGDAIFTKVKVRLNSAWPDYVFSASYKLPSLEELEQYIEKYHHLPKMLSAAEVESQGVDVAENQKMLLEKIEELTLYLIEQNKKIDFQSKEIEELKKAMKR